MKIFLIKERQFILAFIVGLSLFGILFVSLAFGNIPQPRVFNHPLHLRKAPSGFQKISQHFQQTKILRADFSQTKKIKVLRRPLKSKGQFLFSSKHGIYWKTTHPFLSEILITDQGLFQRKNGKLISQLSSKQQPTVQGVLNAFILVFSGKFEEMDSYFSLFFFQKGTHWEIGFIPKQKGLSQLIHQMILTGDSYTSFQSFLIIETNGDSTNIEFQTNKDYAPLSVVEQQYFE